MLEYAEERQDHCFLTNLLKPYKTNFYEKAKLNTKFTLIHMVLRWLNITKFKTT